MKKRQIIVHTKSNDKFNIALTDNSLESVKVRFAFEPKLIKDGDVVGDLLFDASDEQTTSVYQKEIIVPAFRILKMWSPTTQIKCH